MSLSLATIHNDFYARAATASAGATLRALLGATSSIIPADKLARATSAAALPTLPLLAWRAGTIAGVPEAVVRLFFHWYVYDVSEKQYVRINPIVSALIDLYPGHPVVFSGYAVTGIQVAQERPDLALFNLPVRAVTFQLTTRI